MKYFAFLCLLGLMAFTSRPATLPVVNDDTLVYDVIRSLSMPERADVMVRPVPGASAEIGRRLVLEGLRPKGGRQSAHFTCTSCHNVVREDPVLTTYDPEARLAYAEENDLPFLPGTTLWGAVNRESYYNGDYEKKYGDLVKNARRDLRGAIQLCATECAQGEALNELEMESVLSYLHTIGLTLSDLPAEAPDKATFVLPPEDRRAGYPVAGERNPEAGGALYQRACLHCHEDQRYSFFELAENQFHYDFLTKHFPRYTRYSTYQVSRYGTSPIPGKRAYMPHYTKERMTDAQIEDLRAYLAAGASR